MKPVKTIGKLLSGETVKITAFGDSLTYGWMVGKGYIDFLHEMLKEKYPGSDVVFLNRGVPGDTARDGLRRIKEVTSKTADLVLVEFGLNDLYTGYSDGEFLKNLELIIRDIRESMDAEIVLLTSVYVRMAPEYSRMLEFYKTINLAAEKHSLPVVNVHSYWEYKVQSGIDFYRLVQADGVHPTEEGYRLFAEAVMSML